MIPSLHWCRTGAACLGKSFSQYHAPPVEENTIRRSLRCFHAVISSNDRPWYNGAGHSRDLRGQQHHDRGSVRGYSRIEDWLRLEPEKCAFSGK